VLRLVRGVQRGRKWLLPVLSGAGSGRGGWLWELFTLLSGEACPAACLAHISLVTDGGWGCEVGRGC
jgi:hypothetical protein